MVGPSARWFAPGSRNGDPVCQPSRPDGGGNADVIATLAEYAASFDIALALMNDQLEKLRWALLRFDSAVEGV